MSNDKPYAQLNHAEIENEWRQQCKLYEKYKAKNLSLNMARGKPGIDQLNLSDEMLCSLSPDEIKSSAGDDCRSYGLPDGIPEARQLFSDLLDIPAENIIVCGNSSLNIMYDTAARAMPVSYTHLAALSLSPGHLCFQRLRMLFQKRPCKPNSALLRAVGKRGGCHNSS